MNSINVWNAELYDKNLGFVSEFGKGVVELLNPQRGEKILDLGCGTGDLTYEIAKAGSTVFGIDLSQSMIEKARQKYPKIRFNVENGEDFRTIESYDAVFSNAALHWMKRPSKVVESVWLALRSGGRFVAEFGGQGNVETIIQGITDVLSQQYEMDATERNPWYFPSVGEYSSLLEQQGFRVTYALHFDRSTSLVDGENGLNHWLKGFGADFFQEFSESQQLILLEEIKEKLRPSLYHNGTWYADYKRIRIAAAKR
jgi:trans-aconitate methyltransferase